MDYVAQLKNLPKQHEFFIGFDSDGCVFDSMEIKHKECFCPAFIKHLGLQGASKFARQVWDFVNLYSKTRGCNRFLAIQNAVKLINDWPEFARRGIDAIQLPEADKWIEEETKLGNPALEEKVKATDSKELAMLLAWSKEVNERIEDMVYGISPFPGVKDVLETAKDNADIIVVSQTPLEALTREWAENKIDGYLECIAGQEHGTKTEHIQFAAGGKYDPDKILMVGDAPGDLKAAQANNALFFPIVPGQEEKSWAELSTNGIKRFFDGSFAGDYQQTLISEFDAALPVNPPWK